MCKILVRRFPKGELVTGCYGFAMKPFSKSINPYDTFTPSLSILWRIFTELELYPRSWWVYKV